MTQEFDDLLDKARRDVAAAADARTLDALRVDLLGKKGRITELLKRLATLQGEERKAWGERVNTLKDAVASAIETRASALADQELRARLAAEAIDVTLSGRGDATGGLHPITRTIDRICQLFGELGFETVEGPEVEDDFHNFNALNIPEAHPARAMQDTFYVMNGARLLRTHTSPVQIRTMQARTPPIRIICPGRVYRCDSDRTHSPMFHQIEGLYVAEKVTFADLKYDLQTFLSRFFERDVEALFRPSYFPFVEPGADVHMRWAQADGSSRWLELLGCGMVHPKVFEAVGIDPERYTGYAFGMGVERMAMLRYGVDDLRLFFNNDLRFLEQFK
ncbi:MAG: phenylalanine--tRNA ligase subunit alpha [Sinimarinibacterium sp.]|jgi:phenylalanyl-tRNA synthetase alpha chain